MSEHTTQQLADQILTRIRKRTGRAVSLDSLGKSLKAEPSELSRAFDLLKELGYKIRRRKETATFVAASDALIDTEISHQLRTKTIGRRIHAYRSVKSTNDIAAELAQSGAPEGTIVTAEEQTKGRGRLGRTWHSPPGLSIYVSIVLKPKFKPDKAPGVAIMTALALAEAIAKFCPGDVRIKWPNDILINGRKAAGILTELAADKNRVEHIVIGVGVNINHRTDDFPDELRSIATSLRIVKRRKVRRVPLLQQFLRNFEREYDRYRKSQLAGARKKIRKYSSLMGHMVRLSFGNRIVEGVAMDIDATGALIVEQNGERRIVTSGEVTVVKSGG